MILRYHSILEDQNPETVFGWHCRTGALERLTPPWAIVDLLDRKGAIDNEGEVALRIHKGPCSYRWLLKHSDYVKDVQFCDKQRSGPFSSWKHIHKFEALGKEGTRLIDEIELKLPFGHIGTALGRGFIERELNRLFDFRYRRLLTDLERHKRYREYPRLTVAITGSSGLIGNNLAHFLTTGGHKIIRLVRDRSALGEGKIYWNPREEEIDLDGLATADAVVNLGGVSIADRRWNAARKHLIHESRIQGTSLLARSLGKLRNGPKVLISGSATGYYGSSSQLDLEESTRQGNGFLADVCGAWEQATEPAARAGIRVAHIRTGVVLSGSGGALQRMLLPFLMGIGGRLGDGEQFLSWIDLDDVVGAIHHILMSTDLEGPVNVTSPYPVTNSTFTSALGSVLRRPTMIPIPKYAISTLFGEMGREALLQGQHVFPQKLTASGFRFFYEKPEHSLRFQLGRMRK